MVVMPHFTDNYRCANGTSAMQKKGKFCFWLGLKQAVKMAGFFLEKKLEKVNTSEERKQFISHPKLVRLGLIYKGSLQLISSLLFALLAFYEKYTVLLEALFIWSSKKKRTSSPFFFLRYNM